MQVVTAGEGDVRRPHNVHRHAPGRGRRGARADATGAAPETDRTAGGVRAATAGSAARDQASLPLRLRSSSSSRLSRSRHFWRRTRACRRPPFPLRRSRCPMEQCSSIPRPRRLPHKALPEYTTPHHPGDSRMFRHLPLLANPRFVRIITKESIGHQIFMQSRVDFGGKRVISN